MSNIIVLAFIYLIGISLLLIFNELVYRRLNAKGEITRKFAHFASLLATIPFPYIFPSQWYVLVLAFLFAAVLFFTRNGKQLRSIHDVERKSVGSYLLPITIYTLFLIYTLSGNKLLYILPILILSICDPMAAILGINIKSFNGRVKIFGRKLNKTWLGSGAFLLTSFIISLIVLYFHFRIFNFEMLWLAIVLAIVTTFAELISSRGFDNLSIPLSAVLVLTIYY